MHALPKLSINVSICTAYRGVLVSLQSPYVIRQLCYISYKLTFDRDRRVQLNMGSRRLVGGRGGLRSLALCKSERYKLR